MSAFDAALAFLFRPEIEGAGKVSDDPADPGGLTRWGISQRAYPTEDIANLTRERAAFLYQRDYWAPCHGDRLPPALALMTFDAAVNQGRRHAAVWLQIAVGATADGIVGVDTIAAAARADLGSTLDTLAACREQHYRTLPGFPRFGGGWLARIQACKAAALALKEI